MKSDIKPMADLKPVDSSENFSSKPDKINNANQYVPSSRDNDGS